MFSRPGDASETMQSVTEHVPSRSSWFFRVCRRVLLGTLLIGALVVGGTAFRVWQVARTDDRHHADIAVVLGAAQYGGTPSDVLEARLQHAHRLYQQGVVDRVVTVGGRRAGDVYTEAEAGRMWLVENGVPESDVVAVGEGSDTLGSLQAVARVAHRAGWRTAVIVSDPWHSLRCRTMARDAGLLAWASPTRRGPIVQTRSTQIHYILRETAALLHYRLTHAPVQAVDSGLG